MTDFPILESLHLVGGARFETTDLQVDSTGFQTAEIFEGRIDQQDWLPSAGLNWNFVEKMNLRASFSKTVARPTYREFAKYRSFDIAGNELVEGNPNLKMTGIDNYDLRWEWFPNPGEVVAVSVFYKHLIDPIEKFSAVTSEDGDISWNVPSDFVTFLNSPEADVYGIEFETRKNLDLIHESLKPFSLGFNFAYIVSEVPYPDDIRDIKFNATGEVVDTRPLFDQSPYIANVDLSYDNVQTGTSATLAFYIAGERLFSVINRGWDIYEQPAPQLDLVVSQDLGKGWSMRFKAENLLDPNFTRSYAVNSPTDTSYLYAQFRKGITFSLSGSKEF
jgi:TonB-dependent receptor